MSKVNINEIDFMTFATTLLDKQLTDTQITLNRLKSESEPDFAKVEVSLELIRRTVKEISWKIPEARDNGYNFADAPLFRDEEERLNHINEIIELNTPD